MAATSESMSSGSTAGHRWRVSRGRRSCSSVLAAAAMALVSACATTPGGGADDYPTRSVRWIVPFSAGGTTDTQARALAPCMEKALGKPVVVEAKPGGGGVVGMSEFVRERADGYTLAYTSSNPVALGPLVVGDAGYTQKDIVPIGVATRTPYLLYVSGSSPYRTAKELFAAAAQDPGSVTVASPGKTTMQGVIVDLLGTNYDVPMQQVPVQSNADTARGVIGGDYTAGFTAADSSLLKQISSGSLRVVAVGADERVPYLPDAATFAELGYDKLLPTMGLDFLLAAQAGTPAPVVAKLESALRQCTSDPAVVERVGKEWFPQQFVGSATLAADLAELGSVLTGAVRK